MYGGGAADVLQQVAATVGTLPACVVAPWPRGLWLPHGPVACTSCTATNAARVVATAAPFLLQQPPPLHLHLHCSLAPALACNPALPTARAHYVLPSGSVFVNFTRDGVDADARAQGLQGGLPLQVDPGAFAPVFEAKGVSNDKPVVVGLASPRLHGAPGGGGEAQWQLT